MRKRLTAAALAVCMVMAAFTVRLAAGMGMHVSALSVWQVTEGSRTDVEELLQKALDTDAEYSRLHNELAMQKIDLGQALKEAASDNWEEYQWSALASVTLSDEESLKEYYSRMTLPTLLQAGVDATEAGMDSREYELESQINSLSVQIAAYQDRISLQTQQLEEYSASLTNMKVLVKAGEADSALADTLSETIEALSEAIAADQSSLDAARDQLSVLTGEEISEESVFEIRAVMRIFPEEFQDELVEWTIEKDDTYLTVWASCLEALLDLWTDYTVLNEEYAIPDSIFEYLLKAAALEEIDTDAFYEEYTAYWEKRGAALEQMALIEASWSESGEADLEQTIQDGSAAEEDSYALYDAILEYQNLAMELNALTQTITESVEEACDELISLRDTWIELLEELDNLQNDLKLYRVQYRMGELSQEEYQALMDEVNALSLEVSDAECAYLQSYKALNSVTKGGLTAYELDELGTDTDEEDTLLEETRIVVYIQAYPSQNQVSLGVYVPREYEDSIVWFELWNGETMLGSRTSTEQKLTLNSLTISTPDLLISLYDEAGGLLGEYEIDPSVPVSGILVKTEYEIK